MAFKSASNRHSLVLLWNSVLTSSCHTLFFGVKLLVFFHKKKNFHRTADVLKKLMWRRLRSRWSYVAGYVVVVRTSLLFGQARSFWGSLPCNWGTWYSSSTMKLSFLFLNGFWLDTEPLPPNRVLNWGRQCSFSTLKLSCLVPILLSCSLTGRQRFILLCNSLLRIFLSALGHRVSLTWMLVGFMFLRMWRDLYGRYQL